MSILFIFVWAFVDNWKCFCLEKVYWRFSAASVLGWVEADALVESDECASEDSVVFLAIY